MRAILLIIFFLGAFETPAQMVNNSVPDKTQMQLDSISRTVGSLSKLSSKLSDLEKRVDQQGTITDKTLNSISIHLSAASYALSVFGLIFTIAAVFLGLYISNAEKKVVRISGEVKDSLSHILLIKEEVVALNALIQSDIKGLYEKLRREETTSMINRLLNVPHDIANLQWQLLSRELIHEDFNHLKQAYAALDKSSEDSSEYKPHYKQLFFQHFTREAFSDEELRPTMVEFASTFIESAFPNDIIKSAGDYATFLVDSGIQSNGSIIHSFVKAINESKYKNLTSVYEAMSTGLVSRPNRFIFFNSLDNIEHKYSKLFFGKLLRQNYQDTKLTGSEQAALEVLAQLENETPTA